MNPLLDPNANLVIAHRGDSAFAPENTMVALEQGLALGVDALEFDVRLTRDGHAVLMHDATLERTTNGIGAVNQQTLADLQKLDAGCRFTSDGGRTFPFRSRGITIPTLESVLAAFRDVPFILEIKSAEASMEVKRLLTLAGAANRALVASFSDVALAPFRGSTFALGASRPEIIKLYGRALLPGSPSQLSYDALAIPPNLRALPLPVLRFARMARNAGRTTHVWTVDDSEQARRYWAGGVNGIITNDPGAILASAGRGRAASSPRALSPVA
jgi:glycerophosphoryl diester phosphodiesterase